MRVKKYIITALFTTFTIPLIWASSSDLNDQIDEPRLIKLAPAKILEKNINEVMSGPHFLEKTRLHKDLGGTVKSLKEIDLAIELAILNYFNYFQQADTSPKILILLQENVRTNEPSLKKAILDSKIQNYF